MLEKIANRFDSLQTMDSARIRVGAWVVVIGLLGCSGLERARAADQQPPADGSAAHRLLPQVSELPAIYHPVGELAGRGVFYGTSEGTSFRIDDGNHYHGYDGPGVWAQDAQGVRTQGLLYGIDDGAVVSAGYLIRQMDLVAGKSLHGLTLRELDLPVAYSMTVDLIEGESEDSNQYLLLWHFTPSDDVAPPMLMAGQLPLATSLPRGYEVFACDHIPETRFCPGMGRHFIDLSAPGTDPTFSRQPSATGDVGVIYGGGWQAHLYRIRLQPAGFCERRFLARGDTTGRSPHPSHRQRPRLAFRTRWVDERKLHGAHVFYPRGNLSGLGEGAIDTVATIARSPSYHCY